MTEKIIEGPGASDVTTYVWEIAIILLVAFILGYLLRLMLNDRYKDRIEELEHDIAILKAKEQDVTEDKEAEDKLQLKVNEQATLINSLNSKLTACTTERTRLQNSYNIIKSERDSERLKFDSAATKPDVTVPAVEKPVLTMAPLVTSAISGTKKSSVGASKDDLKKIEGIGPKIEELLNNDGIYTYKELDAAAVDRIKSVLIAAGPNYAVHDPSTWGEQAVLADSGKWDELNKLQEELKGGKRK